MIFKNLGLHPILSNPLIWILLTGILCGLMLYKLKKIFFNGKNQVVNKKKKIINFIIILDLLIFFIILAILFVELNKLFQLHNLIIFIIIVIISFLSFEFKKTIGILSTTLIILLIILFILFLQSIFIFFERTEIAKIKILSFDNNIMKIELNEPQTKTNYIFEMEGEYFAPIVKLIIFNDLLVFFGSKTAYKLIGFTSFVLSNNSLPIQKTLYKIERPNGLPEYIYKFVENNEKFIPGIKSAQIDISLKKVFSKENYRIFINNKGGIEIIND